MNWLLCPVCKQTIYRVNTHECPEYIALEFKAMIDATVDFEMDDFNNIVDGFWCEPDVRFMEFLAEKGEI